MENGQAGHCGTHNANSLVGEASPNPFEQRLRRWLRVPAERFFRASGPRRDAGNPSAFVTLIWTGFLFFCFRFRRFVPLFRLRTCLRRLRWLPVRLRFRLSLLFRFGFLFCLPLRLRFFRRLFLLTVQHSVHVGLDRQQFPHLIPRLAVIGIGRFLFRQKRGILGL